ncbi:SNF2 helicase-associated domain-containing protein [Bacillus licheniformis]|nr:SNF2 helicase-associated domain-containing protein [Bacillus licheniformis]
MPWLTIESGTSLLTEEEAWIFLSEASETLVSMGIEILLPSWWQIVRDSNMLLKAKCHRLPRRVFVGMNALMDFNWRLPPMELNSQRKNSSSLSPIKTACQYTRAVDQNRPEFIKQ